MAESIGTPTLKRRVAAGSGVSATDASPPPGRERRRNSKWWLIPNFSYLLLWWVAVIGLYAVFGSILGRAHNRPIDTAMISDGWYAILACGVIGAFYARRLRPLWFVISAALALLILLAMLLVLGALWKLINP